MSSERSNHNEVFDLILASASPRRVDILNQIGVRFSVAPADINESQWSNESSAEFVCRLASQKAKTGYDAQIGSQPVLGADTIVLCNEQIFGKPKDYSDSKRMLSQLSGRAHKVISAVAINNGIESAVLMSETLVIFRAISEQECLNYWSTGEPVGKAGSYAIQGFGSIFVESIEGSYSGVVGLPIAETCRLLRRFEIPIWQSLSV
ncbi:MAG: septum formation inhibitor Maf [Porticoccaceae bacterium]|nr:septum formation inhibitor Maf [Porticoccaceae bacterium]MBT5104312.1 septum formation inhibitor Maf [Porticoccaceae bacterium]MBT6421663.1 septum formation inhibitor Maf [Porticoccaceae bacterium]MBT6798819.1 septum formation inhibitor Maf [Porticoccaceae bacterium]MBT7167697.1 septum formation inhibitor Maf [Porticoccaceae bacterium]